MIRSKIDSTFMYFFDQGKCLEAYKVFGAHLNKDENGSIVKTLLDKIAEHDTAIGNITYVPISISEFKATFTDENGTAYELENVEVGQTISEVVLTWSLAGKLNTLSLTGTGITGAITNTSLRTKTISGLSIKADSTKGSWTLTVTGEKGETAEPKTIYSPTFKRRVYFGVSDLDSLDEAGVEALLSALATSRAKTWTPSCSNQYIYYCFHIHSYSSGIQVPLTAAYPCSYHSGCGMDRAFDTARHRQQHILYELHCHNLRSDGCDDRLRYTYVEQLRPVQSRSRQKRGSRIGCQGYDTNRIYLRYNTRRMRLRYIADFYTEFNFQRRRSAC